MDYFERKLDDKNRLTLPKELRLEFGDKVVITRGFAGYLHMYPERIWQQEMEGALRGDILDERVADLNVRFRSGKTVSAVDQKQGRITLEAHQLSYAGIERDVVAVRAGNYFRLVARDKA
jgi:MraZ protein